MPASLDGLSRAQRAAVTHPGGPLLIVAGAGTGKTRTLTRRFAWLVEQGVPADEVLALTFSVAGRGGDARAAGGADRVALRGACTWPPSTPSARACSRTRRWRPGVDPFFTPVTPADRLALLLERQGELTIRRHEIRGNPAPLLASFVARIDRLKDELVTAEEYRTLRRGARGARGRAGRRRGARHRGPGAGVRRDLRRPRPPAGRARRAGLRRPRHARVPPAARAPARARAHVASAIGTCWSTSTRTRTSPRGCCSACWWTSTAT